MTIGRLEGICRVVAGGFIIMLAIPIICRSLSHIPIVQYYFPGSYWIVVTHLDDEQFNDEKLCRQLIRDLSKRSNLYLPETRHDETAPGTQFHWEEGPGISRLLIGPFGVSRDAESVRSSILLSLGYEGTIAGWPRLQSNHLISDGMLFDGRILDGL